MIPAAFDYEVAESVEHATELLASREDAKLLAGATKGFFLGGYKILRSLGEGGMNARCVGLSAPVGAPHPNCERQSFADPRR